MSRSASGRGSGNDSFRAIFQSSTRREYSYRPTINIALWSLFDFELYKLHS